jgi:hypothetical protein
VTPLGEVTEEVRGFYRQAKEGGGLAYILADALRDQLAVRLQFEWSVEHVNYGKDCCADPRHDWTDADWQAQAEKMLRGGNK